MTAEDASDSLVTLNQMVDTWSAEGSTIYARSTDTKVMTGASSYTMGTGGDISTTRPVFITDATYTLGTTIYPLRVYASNARAQLSNVTQSGIPEALYVNTGNPLYTIQINPIPASGTLTLYSMKPLGSFGMDDVLALPPGYEETLKYNLGIRLAPEYERDVSREIKDIARDGLLVVKRNNRQYSQPLMRVDSGLVSRRFDIDSGTYR